MVSQTAQDILDIIDALGPGESFTPGFDGKEIYKRRQLLAPFCRKYGVPLDFIGDIDPPLTFEGMPQDYGGQSVHVIQVFIPTGVPTDKPKPRLLLEAAVPTQAAEMPHTRVSGILPCYDADGRSVLLDAGEVVTVSEFDSYRENGKDVFRARVGTPTRPEFHAEAVFSIDAHNKPYLLRPATGRIQFISQGYDMPVHNVPNTLPSTYITRNTEGKVVVGFRHPSASEFQIDVQFDLCALAKQQ